MSNIFSRLLFSLLVGIISGLMALLVLGTIQISFTYLEVEDLISRFFINEIGEELIKFLAIFFVLNLLVLEKKSWLLGILCSIFVGFGFGLFEIFLIILSGGISETLGIFIVLGIHSLTSLFIGIAILSWRLEQKWLFPFIFILVAIGVHIAYNLFALNFY